MSAKAEEVFTKLKEAIASDQIILPTLPEVAIKAQ